MSSLSPVAAGLAVSFHSELKHTFGTFEYCTENDDVITSMSSSAACNHATAFNVHRSEQRMREHVQTDTLEDKEDRRDQRGKVSEEDQDEVCESSPSLCQTSLVSL